MHGHIFAFYKKWAWPQCIMGNRKLPYLPVYKSIPCISRPSILEPKNKFLLFLGENYGEKLILYLRTFFQACYSYTKKNHTKFGCKVYYCAYMSVKACFSNTSISCIFFIIFEISLQTHTYQSLTNLPRGGSRGRVQGVRNPPWDEAFFFVYTYSLLKFCTSPSVASFLRGAPLLRKILDPPLLPRCGEL